MTKYIVHGGKPLFGEVEISGAKNAAVAIIPAAILVDGVCRIENIPQISDVTAILKILEQLGASIRSINRHTVEIDSRHIHTTRTSYELSRKLRASYYLIGALLGRFGRAEVAMPGGCNFGGVRPIDQHVKGFSALGAGVTTEGGYINAIVESGRLTGANIYLDVVSVGATMNIMMAAALAQGDTVIENCAKEPHIVDLANFLNSMGADIRGAGTDTIKIRGVERLSGGSYAIIPDQIEAGTYMAAVAATGGQILVKNIIPKHMDCITAKLQECGVEVEEQDDTLLVRRTARLKKANVKTLPYPGFPTDMQPQMTTVLTLAQGTSLVTEGVWSSRYRYVDELKRMGARIQVDDKTAVVEGVEKLTGAPIQAYDLRAGAALVIAALAAEGESEISNVHRLDGDGNNQFGAGISGNAFLRGGRCHGVFRVIKADDIDRLVGNFDRHFRLSISLFPSVVAIRILSSAVPLFCGDGVCCVSNLRDIQSKIFRQSIGKDRIFIGLDFQLGNFLNDLLEHIVEGIAVLCRQVVIGCRAVEILCDFPRLTTNQPMAGIFSNSDLRCRIKVAG